MTKNFNKDSLIGKSFKHNSKYGASDWTDTIVRAYFLTDSLGDEQPELVVVGEKHGNKYLYSEIEILEDANNGTK